MRILGIALVVCGMLPVAIPHHDQHAPSIGKQPQPQYTGLSERTRCVNGIGDDLRDHQFNIFTNTQSPLPQHRPGMQPCARHGSGKQSKCG